MFSDPLAHMARARLRFALLAAVCASGCMRSHDLATSQAPAVEAAENAEAGREAGAADGGAMGGGAKVADDETATAGSSDSTAVGASDEGSDLTEASSMAGADGAAESGGAAAPVLTIPDDCEEPAIGNPPETLRCTGLYEDVAEKKIAAVMRAFAPAHQLWSDGADKARWVYLPPETTIDNADPDDWRLPVGTKLFKEFAWQGRRVETRMFHKTSDTRWVKATYHWNENETEATRHPGGVVDVDGYPYAIPDGKQCDQCHKGRRDRALGFEQLLLSLPGAEGLTLKALIAEDRLSEPPAEVSGALHGGADGGAGALGYLHANCGVCCHNDNLAADAYSTGMYLRLPASAADGRPFAELDPFVTTVDKEAMTPRWGDETRIVPGHPEKSLVVQLMNLRDPGNPKDRMPPIGSVVVDDAGVELVSKWIESLSQ